MYIYIYIYIYIHTYVYVDSYLCPSDSPCRQIRNAIGLSARIPVKLQATFRHSKRYVAKTSKQHTRDPEAAIRPVRLLRVWISEGLTQANSQFSGVGILMSVEFDRRSLGKFDSRTLNRKTLSRWTGRASAEILGKSRLPKSLSCAVVIV